ncbi:hypothetical protein R1flu_010652 [Riccia fluitans]|uniref:Cell division control protein n=1 Tax=Riccia fluitans TaxID=41844 RepID=A0ABD1Z5L1_9MARC
MASPEVLDSSGLMDSVLSEELSGSAPGGWTKKLMPRKVGTPKRKDVVFISPEGEEFKTKKQLDKYLKTHPGGPPSADFDWSTGETPRRSARLNSKGRLSSDSTEAEPVSKRSRRSLDERSPGSSTTPTRRGRKSQAPVDENNKPAEDEIMQEALNEQDEGSAPATEVEAPEKEAEAEEVSKDEAAVVNESKEEVAAVAEGENQLSSSEEPQSIVVKERGRDKLQTSGRPNDETQKNKDSSRSLQGDRIDGSMRPRESWNATDSSHVQAVKTALHLSAVPETIVCRESEHASVIGFCKLCIVEQRAGSIYLCGCPGTGKSLTMEKVRLLSSTWSAEAGTSPPQIVALNCTTLTDPRHIYLKILQALDPSHTGGDTPGSGPRLKELRKLVCHTTNVRSRQKMLLLIVDEMDYLITRDQSVLYDLFRLPSLASSRCILVGIANSIDLTDRLLPKLRSLNCKVDVITFPAYTKDQILTVLQQRLEGLPYVVFKDAALELCARKVSAATGDMRKALHVCRSAVDIIESKLRGGSKDLDEESRSGAAELIPPKQKLPQKKSSLVGLDIMAMALSRIFRSPVVETIQALPRHQQMVLCAAVHRFRRAKKDATLGELNAAYVDFCKSTGMQTLTSAEFSNICQVLADQALLTLGSNREDRLRRVTLKPDQDDVIFALQGVRFFANCLSSM